MDGPSKRRDVMLKILLSAAALLLFVLSPGHVFGGEEPAAAPFFDIEDPADAGSAEEEKTKKPFNEFDLDDFMHITVHGDLWFYHIRTHETYHLDGETADFTEMTARIGADFSFKDAEWLTAQFRAVGSDVFGDPDNWTAPRREDFHARIDLANVALAGDIGGMPSSLTVGFQEFCYGDGLLIYDGYSEKRGVWTTAIRSMPGVKWTLALCEDCNIDVFAAIVHDDRLSYEAYLGSGVGIEGGGNVYGTNVNCPTESLGTIDVGLFLKDEDIRPDENGGFDTGSNTWALSLRDSVDIDQFNVTGEIVKQWGRTRVVQNSICDAFMCPNELHSRDSWGGHLSLRYNFTADDGAPYLTARYAHFQGDREGTSAVESFDPFFYGFTDWGYWYLGDMTSYSLTNTNERALSLEFGIVPVEKTNLRVFLYDFSMDENLAFSSSRSWSNEVNVIFDYYPCDYAFVGAMVGAATPNKAAEDFYGDDRTQTEVMVWAGLYF
jgi:hypothetical protein